MMGNKWVQAAMLLGVAAGIWVGGWLSLLNPLACLVAPVPVGLLAMWIGANARGTDGWGGPWNGPKD